MRSGITEVLSNTMIAGDIGYLTVSRDHPAKPGQFYMLRSEHSAVLLPRAISLCDIRDEEARFLYKIVGRGTSELSRLRPGERILMTGPLGNGFETVNISGPVALVGGGVGIAPFVYTARELSENGVDVDCYCGFPDQAYLLDEIRESACELYVATESGNAGYRGFVTDLLEPSRYAAVYCCGPTPMLKAVTRKCMDAGVPVYVSLEAKMACGIGACLVCSCVSIQDGRKRVCADGPVFRGEDVDFDA